MVCDGCGAERTTLLISKKDCKFYCSKCILEHDPPKLKLNQIGDGRLWNRDTRKYEDWMQLADFEACGWFVRKQKVTQKHTLAYDEIEYELEYYGTRICRRCTDRYEFSPHKYRKCTNVLCTMDDMNPYGRADDHRNTFL